ncbi:S8 family peptidase [Sphingomonas sp. DT-51]|uniref:S8 family peptidase n=1 Tax=Sphingomonas sp. DT-51 TaxID=3396165 RepID=UPI003F1A7C8C
MRRAAMVMALLVPASASLASAPAASTAPADAGTTRPAAERRILVMLDLPPEHYRPGADYGGGYGDAAAAAARRRLAARLAREQGLTLLDAWPMPLLGVDCVIMAVPGSEPLDAVAARMGRQSGVAWSQPMNEFTAQAATPGQPNDRLFAAQPAARAWQLAALHRLATGAGVSVAVIDSLVDAHHPDLVGRVAVIRDFVSAPGAVAAEAHGTGVAGIIAAQANNGLGIAGIAPGARLLGLRACWQRSASATVCDSLSLARALLYATERRAEVINMSLTGPSDPLIAKLVALAQRRGAAVVAAVDPRTGSGFPASLPGVVRVAQDGLASQRTGVYNAPGRDVPTTEPGGQWDLVSGNSYAAAHVSGLLALTRQLRRADDDLVAARADGGEIDACATVRRAAGAHAGAC